jgi:alpha-tubulin suppressor-like RCC1 family protein
MRKYILLGIVLVLLIALIALPSPRSVFAESVRESVSLVHPFAPSAAAAAIAAGGNHACALVAGGVKCWGDNSKGQLGDGTTTQHETPVDVLGLTGGVSAITAGYAHTCAIVSGGIKCWGDNSEGQLGDNSTTQRTAPVDVAGLTSGVSAIAAGYSHTCALVGGVVKCWGRNIEGQLGDGSNDQRSAFVDVTGLPAGVAAVATGGYHTCAIVPGGSAKCWGSGLFGQLGNGGNASSNTPVDVSGLTNNVKAITGGAYHTCWLTGDGGVQCAGFNGNGQLGDGTTAWSNTPIDVIGLTRGVSKIAAGASAYHTCAVTSSGGLKCWGQGSCGQLGDSAGVDRSTPVDVFTLTRNVLVSSAGERHTCALMFHGGVKCWGFNDTGQLGDTTIVTRKTAVDVFGLLGNIFFFPAMYR